MRISKRNVNGVAVVEVEGDVDLFTSPGLRTCLKEVSRAHPRRIVVGLARVEHMDSSGVATLLLGLKEARRFGGTVEIASAAEHVKDVLRLSRADEILHLHATVEDALAFPRSDQ